MKRAHKVAAPKPVYTIKNSKYWLDPVEVNGKTPPLFYIFENGRGSIPTPTGVELVEGAIFSTVVGRVRIKHVSGHLETPTMGYAAAGVDPVPARRFAWLEWFVGPVKL